MQLAGEVRHMCLPTTQPKKHVNDKYNRNIPAEQHNLHELDPKEPNMNNPNCLIEQQTVVPCKRSHAVTEA